MLKIFRRLNYILYNFQKWLVIAVFAALLGMSFLQVILRLFFHTGISNAELFTRYMVLWVAFLGAALATYKGRHINLDVISKQLKKFNENLVNLLVNFVSFVICGVLLWAAIIFIGNQMSETETILFMPVWVLELIIPWTFFFMALIFLQRFFDSFGRRKK